MNRISYMPVAREQWENPVISMFLSQMSLSNDVNFWIILLIAAGCYQRVDAQVFSLAQCPTVSVVSNFDSSKVNFNSQSFLSFQVLCPKTKPETYNICIIKPFNIYHWIFFSIFGWQSIWALGTTTATILPSSKLVWIA